MRMAPLSYIGGGSWVRLEADGDVAAGLDHLSFSLDRAGETLFLFRPDWTVIDTLAFGLQSAGISEGRLPDGTGAVTMFPGSGSPAEGNYRLLTNVVFNELLSHAAPPLEQAIELYNPGPQNVDLSGWYLSDSTTNMRKFQIPPGTSVPAGGFVVFYENQFHPANGQGFVLDAGRGGAVYLAEADASGQLTGRRCVVNYGPAEMGVSFGFYDACLAREWTALETPTFGRAAPVDVGDFRRGTGAANTAAKIGAVVVNEIYYAPPSSAGAGAGQEFVELYNRTDLAVPLFDASFPEDTWRLRGAIDFDFPSNISVPPHDYVVVVDFDPAVDTARASDFRNRYGITGTVPLLGPFAGKLDNAGDTVELLRPDAPVGAGQGTAAYVPFIMVDRVDYKPQSPWPAGANGDGQSLQRSDAAGYGSAPLNWVADDPTPGFANAAGQPSAPVVNGQPQSQIAEIDGRAEFETAACGTAPLTYQWIFNGREIPDATNAFLVLEPLLASDVGAYRVRVSNAAGSVESDAAMLTVLGGPNRTPVVALTSPFSGAVFSAPASIGLLAAASDLDGTIERVEFYAGTVRLGTMTEPPFQFVWSDVSQGQWSLSARALDDQGASATSAVVVVTVRGGAGGLLDQDGDGLPATWETAYGLNDQDLSDASGDADGDGFSNWKEYMSGTDPRDPLDFLTLEAVLKTGSGGLDRTLRFFARQGKSYSVQYRDSLAEGVWNNLQNVPAQNASGWLEIADPGLAHQRFYRIVTPTQP